MNTYKGGNGLFGSHSVGSGGIKIVRTTNTAFVGDPSLSDISSGFHDLAWENANLTGGAGAFFGSTKALLGDWQLVGRSLFLGIKNLFSNPMQASSSFLLGVGSTISFLPKTILFPITR